MKTHQRKISQENIKYLSTSKKDQSREHYKSKHIKERSVKRTLKIKTHQRKISQENIKYLNTSKNDQSREH
jgi:hypothetical protein